MKKVLFLDTVHPLIEDELSAAGYLCEHQCGITREEVTDIIGNYYGIIIRSRIKLDEAMLSKADSLKWIGRVGAGLENIDVAYASSKGITCLNSPEGNRDAVGEHSVGILLSLMHNITRADRQVRNRKWIREGNRGMEIKDKTVAIIGYGNMGSAFAQRLNGFEVNVISYDKYKSDYSDGNTRETGMDEIFSEADILSLHVPLTSETYHLVGLDYINKFRKDIILMNTSRGHVVDTMSLVYALKTGKIRGAALDVLEAEENSFEQLSSSFEKEFNYLISCENVVITPHIAGWTKESNIKLAKVLTEKIIRLFPSDS